MNRESDDYKDFCDFVAVRILDCLDEQQIDLLTSINIFYKCLDNAALELGFDSVEVFLVQAQKQKNIDNEIY